MKDYEGQALTDAVDVLHSAGGEVVVEHDVDAFEVDSSGQQRRADQHPNLPGAETVHHVVSLERHRQSGQKKFSLLPFKSLVYFQRHRTPSATDVPAAAYDPHGSRLR